MGLCSDAAWHWTLGLVALCVQLVVLQTSPEVVAMQCKGGVDLANGCCLCMTSLLRQACCLLKSLFSS